MPDIDARRPVVLLDELVIDGEVGRDALLDIALGPELLQQVSASGGPETLRLYRPRPTLAFSGRDCATPGIGRAGAIAQQAGFTPVRRGPGGRAAAYHRGAICLDHVGIDPAGPANIHARFAAFGELLAVALQSVGVDARVGPVPGEYCPGDYSVNDGRGHKLVGTAQRLVRGGWLFSTVILVSDPEPVREVLDGTYAALGLHWDNRTVGAVQTTAPGVQVTDVAAAVVAAYARFAQWEPSAVSDELIALARARTHRHRLPDG